MYLYNSMTKKKELFTPLDQNRVTMYVCGPTVYNYAHIGNARPAVVFDVLYRLLQKVYPNVIYARNITDVEDKINQAAKEQGVPISVITDKFTQAEIEDMEGLGNLEPTMRPKATEHIAEILAMIQQLVDRGHAYEAEGHVLFDVHSFPEYGRLSRRDIEDMRAGARIEVAPYKQDPADFVLWKPSTEDQPGWDSPWGRGRPGWHIECSAMSTAHLGDSIDIHGGGIDLTFPHHENEIAQSRCALGTPCFARVWMHNGFITVEGRKMSKSLGNVHTVHDLRDKYPGEALRLVLLSAHYRQPLDWSEKAAQDAVKTLNRAYGALRDLLDIPVHPQTEVPQAIFEALEDDLNTPKALAQLFELVRQANKCTHQTAEQKTQIKSELLAGGALLGLLQQDPAQWFAQQQQDVDCNAIDALVAEREKARAEKDWARADAIRDQLVNQGIILEDSPTGVRWRCQS